MRDIQEERAKEKVQNGPKDPSHNKVQGTFNQNENV
jgi:hypothetical protein